MRYSALLVHACILARHGQPKPWPKLPPAPLALPLPPLQRDHRQTILPQRMQQPLNALLHLLLRRQQQQHEKPPQQLHDHQHHRRYSTALTPLSLSSLLLSLMQRRRQSSLLPSMHRRRQQQRRQRQWPPRLQQQPLLTPLHRQRNVRQCFGLQRSEVVRVVVANPWRPA